MAGQELGFGPIASMTGIYIVKGRVTLSANLMAAAIKRHPHYTFRVKEHTAQVCTIDFIEDGEVIGTSTFSMQDAQDAGLAGSETYKKFPKNMLYARALSNGAKWYCPDVFGGGPIYTPDELTDRVHYDADGQIAAVEEDAAPANPDIAKAAEEVLDAVAVDEPGPTAEAPKPSAPLATVAQRRLIFAKAKETGLDEAAIRAIVVELTGQAHTDRIPKGQVDEVLEAIGRAVA
jgi:hypothetical protein